jgi:hypothetical protein
VSIFGRVAVLALVALGVSAPAASAHKGNPNFISDPESIQPNAAGLTVDVLNRDDRLEIHNRSGRTVVVKGYGGEPYLRILGDGTVEVNQNSPATYLNTERFGGAEVPKGVSEKAPPRWKKVDKTGTYDWHDHRIHWMAKRRPPQVKDPDKRTKVFSWKVPISVAGKPGAIRGELFWTPRPGGGPPVAAIVAFIAFALASAAVVLVVRRRRSSDTPAKAGTEAW